MEKVRIAINKRVKVIIMKAIQRILKTKYTLGIYRTLLPLLFIAIMLVLSSCSGVQHNTAAVGESSKTMKVSLKADGLEDNNLKANITKKNEFSLNFSDGTPYKLSSDVGKKVYIKFWATWCPICLGGIDELTKFSEEKANDKNIDVITIVSPGVKGEMNTKDFLQWYKKQGYQFKVLIDEGGNIARQFGVRGYPTSIFIDTKGEIAKTQIGHIANSNIDSILQSIH
jgi:thiol-disulfide isomerase/thioredoxin